VLSALSVLSLSMFVECVAFVGVGSALSELGVLTVRVECVERVCISTGLDVCVCVRVCTSVLRLSLCV